MLDRTRIRTRNFRKGRRHGSVVNSILRRLAPSCSLHHEVLDIRVAVYYSIRPEDFRHDLAAENPEHAEYNASALKLLPREYGPECGIVDKLGVSDMSPFPIRASF